MAMFQANTSGSRGQHYYLRLYIDEIGYNIANNTSDVRYRLVLYFVGNAYYSYTYNSSSGRIDAAGQSTPGSIGSIVFNNGIPKEIELMSTQRTITHNPDGTGRADAYGYWNTNTERMGAGEVSGGIDLTKIPRYADINSAYVESVTSTSATIRYSVSRNANIYCSVDDTAWGDPRVYNTTSGTFTITGLSPNVNHSFKILSRATDSGLDRISGYFYGKTYAKTTPTLSLNNKTVNSIEVNSSCNVTTSSIKYRIKQKDGEYLAYQESKVFSNLLPNTDYTIEVYAVGSESKESGTATLNIKTYNYALLNSYPAFNLGDSEIIKYTNESNSEIFAAIYDNSSSKLICEYRKIESSSYTFNFTDTELDNLYKLFNDNTVNIKVYLKTTCNSVNYYDSKTVTVTLTGNQKTGHINVQDSWKRTKRWINVNGTWKRSIRWINVNGVWKKCI